MQDILSRLNALHRPRLLIRAARAGADEYNRTPHLARLLGYGLKAPRSGPALMRLMELESEVNAQRVSGDAAYSLVRHVDLLIAMLAEARLLRATRPDIVG
ncbi:MAG: hypothetical protein GYB25_03775 [Rhodobacteraceae bacterium]|nr:hypothetical protein [Paracoccaceae bacterium]